jgi:tripartite-type tricarboxylate transporter receptor subunit TctC
VIAATPNLLVAHPSFPARTLADLIKLGKQSAAPIQYGSPGVGTLNHPPASCLRRGRASS